MVGTLAVISLSCTNLDEELFSSVTDDQFGKTDEEVSAIVANAYTGWTQFYSGEAWSLAEVASDEMVVPTRGADWFDNGNWQRIHLHAMLPQDDRVQGSWNELFGKGINTANRLIKSFEEAGQLPTDPAIAELRGLRAMIYFWLMDLYGNVPLQESFDDIDLENGSGTDYSQRTLIYNFLISELEDIVAPGVIEGLPLNDKARFNQWAAKMLLAKLYLNEGVYTTAPSTGMYKEASAAARTRVIELTTDVIDNGGYSINSDYFGNFDAQNLGSPENIFQIINDEVFANEFSINMRTLHYGSQDTYNFAAQPWNGYCTLQEFYESFDPAEDKRFGEITVGDPDWTGEVVGNPDQNTGRRSMFVVGPQFASDGSPINDDSQYDEPDGEPLIFTPYINEIGPAAWRQAGARIGKFVFEQGAQQNMNNDYPVFRLADAYFMRAEARWRNGDAAGATADLNIVAAARFESGTLPGGFTLDNGTSRLGDHLLGERGREFAFEYWRRNDLIRFGRYNDPWWGKGAGGDDNSASPPVFGDGAAYTQVFPIPRSALETNPNLNQNPNY